MFYDLKDAITKDYSWESVFRIRISSGWQVSKIRGNFIVKSSDLLSTPNTDENKTYIYEFRINDCPRNDIFSIQVLYK